MKRFILLIGLLLAFTSPAYAGFGYQVIGMGAGVAAATALYCDTKTGYLLCEDMEGSTECATGLESVCRNTWTNVVACSTAPDFTSTPLVGGNTNSVYFNESGAGGYCTYRTGTLGAQAALYVYATIKIGSISVADAAISIIIGMGNNAGTGNYCELIIGSDSGTDYFGVLTGGAATLSGVTPATNTQYHIWLEFVKNTSCSAYISTTSTKPGSATVADTDGVSNSDAYTITLNSQDGTNDVDEIYLDNILVDNAAIPSQ